MGDDRPLPGHKVRNRTLTTTGGDKILHEWQGDGPPLKLDLSVSRMSDFALSPDNRRFAFSVNEGSKSELWVLENFLPPLKAAK